MGRKKRNQLDFDRLSLATIEAVNSLTSEKDKDGLVEYLREQAIQKPTAFLSLLVKVAQLGSFGEQKDESQKITRIELVVPKKKIEDLDNEANEAFE